MLKKTMFLRARALVLALLLSAVSGRSALAQQRPLLTEDPETIGAGRLLIEAGVDYAHNQEYPVTGLEGDLWRIPRAGLSIGVSSIAEIQFDGGPFNRLAIARRETAPLSDALLITGDTTHDVEDIVVGAKFRLRRESARVPSFGFRFTTKLPNASIHNGIGTDTTDFYSSVLVAKTVGSVRIVGNIGFGILGDPTNGHHQNDLMTYGGSFARALSERSEVVGEVNGRLSTRTGDAFPGTESRATMTLGGRYTRGAMRLDAGMFFGLTSVDPTVGFSTGVTYVFHAFDVP